MTEKQKRIALIVAIIISLVPSVMLMHFPALVSPPSVALWLSAIVGYMGIVLLLWMYILGTRSTMGLIFRDPAPVLGIHKWLGKYGTIAIFLHPILITYSYGASWLYSFIPHTATQLDRRILLGQIAFWILVFTWVMSAYLREKITFRGWKYIHYLAYVSVPFALLHVPDLGSQERAHLLVKGYLFMLGLTFVVFSVFRIRSVLNLNRSPYRVVRHARLTDIDYLLTLRPNGGKAIRPRRGQYIYIKLGFLSEDHPFTVVRHDPTTDELMVAYRIAGMYTKELEKLEDGHEVLLEGPYGSFMEELSETSSTPVVYLSGGIGITPFVDRILSENDTREQWLFAANRNRELAVLYRPLKKELGDHAVAVYNALKEAPKPGEEVGYITADLLRKYLKNPLQYQFYLCGPPAMMESLRSTVESLGVAPSAIYSEKFGW